jgi:XTP/dITP diphosphohydrolase
MASSSSSNASATRSRGSMHHTIVLASGNAGKLREINQLLAGLDYEVVPQSQFGIADAAETGSTYIENAIIKARHAAQQSGHAALADDSGLEVDALGGEPGVHSARYAGAGAGDAANLEKLLQALRDVPAAKRTARFHCVMVYMRHARDPMPVVAHGTWDGSIAAEPHGANGFGYDPVFIVPTRNCTSAELPPDEKNRLSHRGQALRALLVALKGNRRA